MSHRLILGWLTIHALWAAGCKQSGSADVASTGTTDPVETSPAAQPHATGIDISKVAITQGIEIVLQEGGVATAAGQSPVIQDRDAVLRVYVTPHEDFESRDVQAVVTIDGDSEVLSSTTNITKASTQDKLASTINVEIPGELLTPGMTLEVDLREAEGSSGSESAGVASWSSEETGGVTVEKTDTLDVVIIPVAYHADGSGRLPDTSEAQLEGIHDLMYGMYPASEVTVTVGEVLDWYQPIDAFSGWDSLLVEVNNLRGQANVAPNTYFYAMFRPTSSFGSFCQSGCVLGLSFLGFSANDPFYRASIGVGYPGDVSIETLPHELGHAHGREHAPCGLYGQPSDSSYPHNNATLGTWGYDLVSGTLVEPVENRDVMSYCTPMWISDYTYYHLFVRIQEVSRQNRSGTTPWRAMRLTPEGEVVPGPTVQLADPSGEPMDVELRDGIGRSLGATTGWFVPYDHLEGGVIMVPDSPDLYTVDVI